MFERRYQFPANITGYENPVAVATEPEVKTAGWVLNLTKGVADQEAQPTKRRSRPIDAADQEVQPTKRRSRPRGVADQEAQPTLRVAGRGLVGRVSPLITSFSRGLIASFKPSGSGMNRLSVQGLYSQRV